MVDRLDGLHHYRIIGSHNQNDDIGDIRTTRPHFGKGLVARRIDKGNDIIIRGFDLIRADMLGNTARFACRNISPANGIKQAGFTVVNVTHYRNDRWPRQ